MGPLVAALAAAVFTFWPQSGLIGQDLYLTNFADLEPAPGRTLDPFCGTRTYDGHSGIDVIIRSFREIAIGVPVYSATDGRVQEVARGGFDFRWGSDTRPADNHVVIVAPDGRTLVYGHLRHDIALRRGDTVRAGRQIGWTASSGNSSWPHLHFTELVGQGVFRDPFAGPCRPGDSDFAEQPQLPAEPYVRNLTVSARPFTGEAQLPWDKAVRTGTFVRGTRDLHFRLELGEHSPGVERVQLVRPDGSVAVDAAPAAVPEGGQYHGQAAFHSTVRVAFDALGTWRLRYALGGTTLVDAPLHVVARASQAGNRRPLAVAAKLHTTANAAVCVVSTPLAWRDPDYDIVRYRYRWTVGGKVVRTVTSAGITDVLPTQAQTPRCTVTPSDGRLSAATVVAR